MERRSSSSPKNRTLVLFVDDNDLIRELWTDMLSQQMPDLVAVHAEDGAEAVRLAHDLQPDLIVMDVQMPTMTGFEATRRLKKNRATSQIPVIAVTGLDFPPTKATEAGCEGYIEKPLSSDQLFAEVCRVLKRPTSSRSDDRSPQAALAGAGTSPRITVPTSLR